MHVLAIEPYFGGSHRAFLESISKRSHHRWTIVGLPARHWKWRMRSAPVSLNDQIAIAFGDTRPDVVVVSDMLDLPTWLGVSSRDVRINRWVTEVPIVTYFHENQWCYPVAPNARIDHHYGYTNLLTALASTACWFNSRYNLDSFFARSFEFLDRMPDSRDCHHLERSKNSSRVIAPGFCPVPTESRSRSSRGADPHGESSLTIGWVGRFEHDKRPDRFLELLRILASNQLSFGLILLGERGRDDTPVQKILQEFGESVKFNGYAELTQEYHGWLKRIDVVVSTAEHEFFGIGICEAISAGAIPLTPNDLSYCEYVPDSLRYDSLAHASHIIQSIRDTNRPQLWDECRSRIEAYEIDRVVRQIDDELTALTA